MIQERNISTISINVVIGELVKFLDHAVGSSGLAAQLEILGASPEGLFAPRDDGDNVRAAMSAENAMVARVDLAGYWKGLKPIERQVIFLLNSPGRHVQYEQVVDKSESLEDEIVVGVERNELQVLTGTRVLRSGRNDYGPQDVATQLGIRRKDVERHNRKGRARIRKNIWEKHVQQAEAIGGVTNVQQ